MDYPAIVTKDGRTLVALFPDCPGCVTQAGPGESIEGQAREALQGWLSSMLAARDIPSPPSRKARAPRGSRVLRVPVPPVLAVRLSLIWARTKAGLSQAQLAARAGISQQQVARLEHPDANPTIETLAKVARALGTDLVVGLGPMTASRLRAYPWSGARMVNKLHG